MAEELFYNEDTLRKVYKALLDNGIYGQKATDIVSSLLNEGILFRENPPKRRGRPPKSSNAVERASQDDAWAPTGEEAAK